jgi:hypothetical protein
MAPPRKITDEMLDLARDLIAAGESMREAAAALECATNTLRHYGVRADPELTRQRYAEFAGSLRKRWTRLLIVQAITSWAELYGAPPAASDWNPAMARRQGRPDRAERHAAGDWPFASTVVRYFGSWGAAIEAAGWHSRPPGNAQEAILHELGIVGVYGEQGDETGPGAYATRKGHRLREAP